MSAAKKVQDEFLIKSYELLFNRNAEAQKHRWAFVQLSLFGILAFYAFAFDPNNGDAVSSYRAVLFWFPVPVCVLGFCVSWGLRKGMIERGRVMHEIEAKMNFDGWEKVRSEMKGPDFIKSPLASAAYLYWLLMLITTTVVACSASNIFAHLKV